MTSSSSDGCSCGGTAPGAPPRTPTQSDTHPPREKNLMNGARRIAATSTSPAMRPPKIKKSVKIDPRSSCKEFVVGSKLNSRSDCSPSPVGHEPTRDAVEGPGLGVRKLRGDAQAANSDVHPVPVMSIEDREHSQISDAVAPMDAAVRQPRFVGRWGTAIPTAIARRSRSCGGIRKSNGVQSENSVVDFATSEDLCSLSP